MTIKNVGFGGAASSTQETLSGLIHEFGSDRILSTINNKSPFLKSGALEEEEADGAEVVVTPMVGALPSTQWVAEFGRLPEGHAPIPTKGRAQPANIVSVLRMGRMATLAKLNNKQLGKEFDRAIQITADDVARHLCRGIFGGSVSPQAVATWDGTAANSVVTINFTDVSLFRPGAAYDFIDTSASLAYVVRCTAVTPAAVGSNSANVAGSASFINDVPNPATGAVVALGDTAVATADVFRLRGTTAGFGGASTVITGVALVSFDDIAGAGASSALHGLDPATVFGWKGQNLALAAPYNQEAMLGFAQRVLTYSGEYPTHAIMGPQVAAAHMVNAGATGAGFGNSAFALQSSRTRQLDATMDKYGAAKDGDGLKMVGLPVISDPNMVATSIILHNKQFTKLYYWQKMAPAEEAGEALLLGRTYFDNTAQFSGSYQLVTEHRAATGMITGITNL